MSKPVCTVMVGLPAAGKSTLVHEVLETYPDAFVYSTDAILERIAEQLGKTYDEVFEKHIKSAQAEADIELAYAMQSGKDIIWDQTNLGIGKRRKIINRMKQAGYQVRCVCIISPEQGHISDQAEWKQRLDNRPGKTIPQNVLTNMINSFSIPSVEEGFDMITFYNIHGALVGAEYGEK